MTDLNKAWQEWIKEDPYTSVYDFIEDGEYEIVRTEIVGEWRWGTMHELVIKTPGGEMIGCAFRDASCDSEIEAHDMQVEFYPVEKRVVEVVKYVRV